MFLTSSTSTVRKFAPDSLWLLRARTASKILCYFQGQVTYLPRQGLCLALQTPAHSCRFSPFDSVARLSPDAPEFFDGRGFLQFLAHFSLQTSPFRFNFRLPRTFQIFPNFDNV